MCRRIFGLFLVLCIFTLPLAAQDNPIRYDEPRFILKSNAKNQPIVDLAYSADGRFLAAAGSTTVVLWLSTTGEGAMQLEAELPLKRIAFLPDGALLVVYGDDKVLIWNIPTGDRRADFSTGQPIIDVAVSADGETVDFAYGTGVSVVNLTAAQVEEVIVHDIVANDSQHYWYAVAFDPTGQYLAAGYIVNGGPQTEFAISMWDIEADELVREYDLDNFWAVTDLEFNPSGTLLAATGTYTRVWDVATGETRFLTTSNGDSGISFGGDYLVVADPAAKYGGYETTALYNVAEGDLVSLFKQSISVTDGRGGDGVFYQPVVFNPNGSQFATLDKDGQVVVWETTSGYVEANTAVNLFADCDDLPMPPPDITTASDVNIYWSWYATEIPLIFDHMGWVNYVITLDGEPLPVNTAQRSPIRRKLAYYNHWVVHYNLNVGTLTPGSHTITYALTWGKAISDGLDDFGPGTDNPENIGSCTFEVVG